MNSLRSSHTSGVRDIMKLLKDTLSGFYQELISALENLNRAEVAQQLSNLSIERYTFDEAASAIYLYTSGVRELNDIEKNIISVKHGECLELNEILGMVVIDLDNFNRIMGIEILDRPDIKNKLK